MSMTRACVAGLLLAWGTTACTGPTAESSTPTFDADFLKNEPKVYSQQREEVLIRHFFKDRKAGVFLDVGSSEWRDNSTTYYLEEKLGWSGIALDARKELADGFKKNRPRTKFFSYVVSDKSGETVKFFSAGGLSSVHEDHLGNFKMPEGFKPVEIEVMSITLDDLLEREKVPHIDFMSMDIEEHEPQALSAFDIRKYAPELVCIEASPSIRERITKYFGDAGYERIDSYLEHDTVNWYYRRKDSH